MYIRNSCSRWLCLLLLALLLAGCGGAAATMPAAPAEPVTEKRQERIGQKNPLLTDAARWQLSDSSDALRLSIDAASIYELTVDKRHIIKAQVKCDYLQPDSLYGSDVAFALLEVWIQPDEETFRVVHRENYDAEYILLSTRKYSLKGKWEPYAGNETWQKTIAAILKRP